MKKGKRLLALCVTLAMVMSTLCGTTLALEKKKNPGKPTTKISKVERQGHPAYQPNPHHIQDSPATMEGDDDEIVASGQCGASVNWKLDWEGELTISGTGAMDDYGWDDNGNWVDAPYEQWWADITSVVIEDGVTTIGESAFNGYGNLYSVKIPNSVTWIGYVAFYGCDFEDVTIPESVTHIGTKALGYRTENGEQDVPIIDFTIYGYSYSAAQIYAKDNGFDFVPEGKINAPTKGSCGKNLTWSYNQENCILTISGTGSMNDYGAYDEAADEYADAPWYRYSEEMKKVMIRSGVTSIGESAFAGCWYIEEVTLPKKMNQIGEDAFSFCESLLSIQLPNGISAIEDSLFEGCSELKYVSIPNTVKSIGDDAFSECWELEEINIPTSVTKIGYSAFYDTAMGYVMIPDSVTKIGDDAFGIFYDEEEEEDFIDADFVIYGYAGTAAAKYAKKYDITFVALLGIPKVSSLTNTSKGVKVAWKKVSGAKGYYIYRSTGKGSYKKVKTTSSLSWTDTGAKSNGTKYNYKVYAYKGKTKSSASKVQSIYYLSAPKISSVKNSAAQKAAVKWGKNTKASGFQVQYSTASNFKGAKTVTVASGQKTGVTLSKLTKKKKYYVRVRAYKTVSGTKYVSAWSGSKNVTIKK